MKKFEKKLFELKLEKKVFDFIVQPENFEVVWNLYDLFPNRNEILRLLFIDLLKEVEKFINNKIDSKKWETKSYTDLENDYPGVELFNVKWNEYFSIQYEIEFKEINSYYGLCRWIKPYSFLLKEEINMKADKIRQIGKGEGFRRSNWWFGYKYIYNFNNFYNAQMLIPKNRDKIVVEISELLINLAYEIEDDVTELARFARQFDPKYKSENK